VELDVSVARHREDLESAQRHARSLSDELVEKDRQLTTAKSSLDSAEKLNRHQRSRVGGPLILSVLQPAVELWYSAYLTEV